MTKQEIPQEIIERVRGLRRKSIDNNGNPVAISVGDFHYNKAIDEVLKILEGK